MAHVSLSVIDAAPEAAAGANNEPRPGARWRWAANIAYAGLLVVMALLPSETLSSPLSPPDWVAHAAAYGVQGALLAWALRPSFGWRRALVAGAAGAILFGLATEGLQLLRPGRTFELRDMVANGVGAVAVCTALAILDALNPRCPR